MTIKQAIRYYDNLIKKFNKVKDVDMSAMIQMLKEKRERYAMKIGKNRGFSLVELMIVIAIIGTMAAIAIPQYSVHLKKKKFIELYKFEPQISSENKNKTIEEWYQESLEIKSIKELVKGKKTSELEPLLKESFSLDSFLCRDSTCTYMLPSTDNFNYFIDMTCDTTEQGTTCTDLIFYKQKL